MTSVVATLLFLGLWAWVVFDVHRTDARFVKGGLKWCWMIFVIALPVLGAVAWYLFGRPMIPVRRDSRIDGVTMGAEDTPEWAAFLDGERGRLA